ncbi:hypothetical protein FRB97_005685 [Tulasnella sp. 331]|nr:hypothetical protein FRB97_005685 [Tulasnella sp. 331]
MSLTWNERVQKLSTLLNVPIGPTVEGGGVDAVGQAIERFVESQKPRGRSAHAPEVEKLRFGNKDLTIVGTLTKGQFGTYAEGGSLEDVLNCAVQGHLPEKDMLWWIPQTVGAIAWCHSEGFIHRDIKPQNFVLTSSAHLKLIDFGSAAPLQPPDAMGVQVTAKKHCLMPCGTVDYIAPEILQICEDVLVAQDLDDEMEMDGEDRGYGKEVDWWSLGAMIYEMACGQAPFFADDIGQTYEKIKSHQNHALEFDPALDLSPDLINLTRMFLCSYPSRLGRRKDDDVRDHRWFRCVRWPVIHIQPTPPELVIPDFSYAAVKPKPFMDFQQQQDDKSDLGHHFSAFFQSSMGMSMTTIGAITPAPQQRPEQRTQPFADFTWGPPADAFSQPSSSAKPTATRHSSRASLQIPASSPFHPSILAIKRPGMRHQHRLSDPSAAAPTFCTPVRPAMHHYPTTIPRTGTGRRVRPVSDREALRQMLVHVGMSARKKVIESGKKPRNLTTTVAFAPLPAFKARSSFVMDVSPRYDDDADDGGDVKKKIRNSPPAPMILNANASITSDSSAPPSPSPRPGSAMSRRSATPGLTTTFRSMSILTTDNTGLKSGRGMLDHSAGFSSASPGHQLFPRVPSSMGMRREPIRSRTPSLSLAPLFPRAEPKRPKSRSPSPSSPQTQTHVQTETQSYPQPVPRDPKDLMSDDKFDRIGIRLNAILGDIKDLEEELAPYRQQLS